ncbi:MAG TPA: hypothetical protein VFG21_04080 [Xanthomonadaceae bacterium]|nr:hypothetical protein [Xanthomonadaceae bacterium]
MRLHSVVLAALALAIAAPPAAAGGSGHFRMGENRQEFQHAYALARQSFSDPPQREVTVYLTSHPVDLSGAAAAVDLDEPFTSQLREVDGSMVRINLPTEPDGGPSMWFYSSEPSDTFNMSGSGEFALEQDTPARVAGSWILAEPSSFFDKTYDFRLEFAADVVDANPKGEALPAGGGEPGAAWLAEVSAVAAKDADFFRKLMPDMAEFLLPKDQPDEVESYFEGRRWSTPKEAKVHGGLLMEDIAILRITGTDYEGRKVSGAVYMSRGEQGWSESSTDLTTHW